VIAADVQPLSSGRWRSIVVDCLLLGFISFVIALGVVLGTAFFHGDRVSSRAEVTHLEYGFPISWITQDQSTFVQPPYPSTTIGVGSPWHNPTGFSLGAFLLDIVIVGAAPFGLSWVVAGGARIAGRQRRPRSGLQTSTA
jgi:hypothetical protein